MITRRTMKLAGIAASLLLSAWAGRVEAVSIPIDNHSFEFPTTATPGQGQTWTDGVPTDWTGSPAGLATWVENNESLMFTGGDGAQHGGIGEDNGYVYQDLGVPFQADMTYRIDLAGAHRAGSNHATAHFGLFSSNAVGTTLGTPGFMDLQGIWSGSANPDADDQFNQLRDASVMQMIDINGDGVGSLAKTYKFDAGSTPPAGNIVVFIRHQGDGDRIQYDNIRLDESPSLQPGDTDGDGDVDLDDFAAIRDHFRLSVTSRAMGDLDDDGFVNFIDFRQWKDNYPFSPLGSGSNAATPEPASWILGLACLLPLCGIRRPRRLG